MFIIVNMQRKPANSSPIIYPTAPSESPNDMTAVWLALMPRRSGHRARTGVRTTQEIPRSMTKVEDAEQSAGSEKPRPAPMMLMARDDDGDRAGQQEFADLLKLYEGSFRNIAEGEVIKGTVLKVSSSEVVVDVGYKSEGMIALQEFIDEEGE